MTATPETTAQTTDVRVALPRQRADLTPLRRVLTGTVHEPHDPAYDGYVTPWNLAVPMHPTAVVAARTADDVVQTVRFAAAHGLTVGVQATGHGAMTSIAGHLLVSTKHLDELTIHPEGWARVGAGVKWTRVIEAATPLGFVALSGSSSDVGIVGYTTGGGVGPFARTFGLAADRVRAFEVVTGDGVFRRVTPEAHPDLFFALRGGKGSAGIVTAVEFDLVRLPEFYGGAIYFDGADAAAVIDRWRGWSTALPEAGTTSFALFQLPELDFVPPPLAGKMTLGVRFAWTGDPAEGERLLDELRGVAPVVLDDAFLRPYTDIDHVHADPIDPLPVVEGSILLSEFPAAAAEQLLAVAGPGSGSPQVMLEIRQLGGALGREGRHPCAWTQREAAYSVLTVGMAPDPTVAPHAELVLAALAEWDTGGVWPNFAPPHDAESAKRAYKPAALEQLRVIARRYDPAGVLSIGGFLREGTADTAAA